MGTYYIPPTMTVSGTPGSSFGQAANLASNFNKTNQAAANAFNVANQPQVSGNAQTYANALNYGSTYPSLNAATGQYQTGTQPPTDYNQHLRGLRAGQDLDPNISSRYPWPNIDRSGFPNTVAGEYAYQQAKAEAQNYAALGQTLGIYEDRGARQMGELEKGAAAARAGLEYDLRNAGRQDAQNAVTAGFGGRVGERYGVTGGQTGPATPAGYKPDYSGWAPRLAEQSQSRRARELTRLEAEQAALRAGVQRWEGDRLGATMSSIDAQYPDYKTFYDIQKGIGAAQVGSGQSFNEKMAGNTGAGFNLIGGQNTVLGQALMGGQQGGGQQGGGQQGGGNQGGNNPGNLAARQQMNRQLLAASRAQDWVEFRRLRELGETFGWTWGGWG